MTAEQSEIARLTLELRNARLAQDHRLQSRTRTLTAMADSLYVELKAEGETLQAACVLEISTHLTELADRLRELLPADNKIITPAPRRVA